MDHRQNNQRPSTTDKPIRPSTTNKYTYKNSVQPFKLENVYYEKNNELMIKTQLGFGRKLTTRQTEEYMKLNPKNKEKNTEELKRRALLMKVNPSFETAFKKQESNNKNKGGRKENSKQYLDEYQMKQANNSYHNEPQRNQSPQLKKQSSNQRQILEVEVQNNIDERIRVLQQKLKQQQEARKKDTSNSSLQTRLLKKQFEELMTKISHQIQGQEQLFSLVSNHKKDCQEQFKEIKRKLSLILQEKNGGISYKDAKATNMQRELARNDPNQEQREKAMGRELERAKSQLRLRQQTEREMKQKYQQLQQKYALIAVKQKTFQEKNAILERNYEETLKNLEKVSTNKISSSKQLFFSPTIYQKQLESFLKNSIQKVTDKALSSTKLLYQLDEFNLSISNYLTRPPFPVLFLFTSEGNHTFAVFSQGIQSHTSRKIRVGQNIHKQFKTILLNCQTQRVLQKDAKSSIDCGANFMENQLMIGSNQLIIKNSNLRSLNFHANNYFGEKYFNIKKRSTLTCEEQDVLTLKTLEIYELFLL